MANTKIPSELIADSAITAAKLADGTITTADIADSNVTTAKIADSNVTTAKIGDAQVTTAKIVDANVTTVKIADDAVTTAKMASNSVTSDTIASGITLAGTTTLSSHLVMGDNDIIKVGDSSDLQIYHDGSNSYVTDAGDGVLFIKSSAGVYLNGTTTDEPLARFIENGAVNLYYDNSLKFNTTSTGIDVTGTATMDGLTVEGDTLSMSHTGNTSTISLTQKAGTQNSVATISANREDTTTSASRLLFNTNDGTSTLQRMRIANGGDISFYEDTGTTAKLLWDASAESLGIGTASPAAKLHISGNSDSGDAYCQLIINDEDSDEGSRIPSIQFTGNGTNTTRMRGTPSGFYLSSSSSMNDDFVVKSDGLIGIGKTPSIWKLDVDSTNGYIASFDGSSNTGIAINSSSGIGDIIGYSNSASSYNKVNIRGASGIGLVVDTSNNVGVGETSPVAKLHVQGTGTSGQVTSSFLLENASSGTAGMDITGAAGSSRLRFLYGPGPSTGTNALTEALNIVLEGSSAGNVGIGTNSPIASVHIKPVGNSWEHSLLLQHSASNTGWNIHPETQDNSLWFGYNADTSLALTSQTANEYLVLDSSGGVGIGNSRPTINAHAAANNLVIGNTSTGDNGMTILGNASNTGRIFFGDPDLNREGQIEYVHNGDYFQFYASNALSFIAKENQIGIGVNPSETLHMYKASGSNEIRNQLGNNSVYMRHGVNRNSPQGTNVFDILGLQNQDIIIGTSNMFLVGDGGVHNSEASNRLRVDGTGVTIGEVLPTLTTTNESIDRRLWVRGQGTFDSQSAGTNPRNDNSALYLGPRTTRDTSSQNPGTAGYDDVQPAGSLSGGIAWDHLKNYSTYGNVTYSTRPHGWLGMELHSTPGYELSNMVMATREGVNSTDETKTAMRWYATGEITTPRNPAFAAYGTGLANQTTEGNHGTWNETIDRGANFTAGTNAYFTAPVDGLYAFWVHCNFNTGSSVPYYWRAIKNTGNAGIFYGAGANQSWDHVMAYIMIAMDKNDTFEWRYKGDPDEGAEWAQCGGYLVG